MGNTGNLGSGDAQLMKAGSGVIHSEMPKQKNGRMRGFQLWINLPAAKKMDHPEYQEYSADVFPVIEESGYRTKVIMGRYGEVASPIQDEVTQVTYLDIELLPGHHFLSPLPEQNNSFLYLFEGALHLNHQQVSIDTLVTVGHGDHNAELVASEQGARFIMVSGKPINEKIVQYGPFVMNRKDEIDQALQDFQSNSFVHDRAWINRKHDAPEQGPKA